MAACQKVFKLWNKTVDIISYQVLVTIDKCLFPYRNQIKFRVYNKGKPKPYGINIHCLNDVKFTLTYRSDIFTGKPKIVEENNPNSYYSPTTQGMTLRLGWEKLKGVNLTTDNLYTIVPLMRELKQHNMTFIGTWRTSRRGLH